MDKLIQPSIGNKDCTIIPYCYVNRLALLTCPDLNFLHYLSRRVERHHPARGGIRHPNPPLPIHKETARAIQHDPTLEN